jgi:hypothetical protein
LTNECDLFADALVCLGNDLFCALTKHREDRELMVGELRVAALNGRLQGGLAIAGGAPSNVDLRELIVQAEGLDDVSPLPCSLQLTTHRSRGLIHARENGVGFRKLLLRRQLRPPLEAHLCLGSWTWTLSYGRSRRAQGNRGHRANPEPS